MILMAWQKLPGSFAATTIPLFQPHPLIPSPFRPLSPSRNVPQDTDANERHHEGRSPITDEGKRESLCRKKPQDDSHVDHNLKSKKTTDPQSKITAVEIRS